MKNQRDKLQQYQKRITKLTDRETAIAKECLSRGQKPKALLALRRKKFQESLLAKTDLQLEQLQRLTSDVEFATVQKSVMYGLQQGTAVLKQIQAEMGGIERVERLLEDNEEARAYQKQVSELLGGQLSNNDEDEVEDELDALGRELEGLQEDEDQVLPDVPGTEPSDGIQEKSQRAKERARARELERKVAEPIAA